MEDVDWVCLAPDRKVWKAFLDMVMSLEVVKEASNCVANGATVPGTFSGGGFFALESCSEVNL